MPINLETPPDWKNSARTPLQAMCYNAYRFALRYGLLVKGPCEVCGTTEGIEGHHEDHSRPLEVRWLCHNHHASHHGKMLVRTPELNARTSQGLIGYPVSSETREKLRAVNLGKRHSPEARQRMNEAQQRRRDRERQLRTNSNV
jgi:hypothetical protein